MNEAQPDYTIHHIEVPRTARYVVAGNTAAYTRLWVACHGYGQLATHFIKKCLPLVQEDTLLIAPEGLSRFYVEGLYGNPGASWMTSEDRDNEIKDYCRYLESLIALFANHRNHRIRLNVLGFSQGVSTVCRWIASTKFQPENIVLWAGELPHDLDIPSFRKKLDRAKLWIVYGKNDPFIDQRMLEQFKEFLDANEIYPEQVITFDGKHDLDASTLKALLKVAV